MAGIAQNHGEGYGHCEWERTTCEMASLVLFHVRNGELSQRNEKGISPRKTWSGSNSHGHELERQSRLSYDVQPVSVLGSAHQEKFSAVRRNDGVAAQHQIGESVELQKIRPKVDCRNREQAQGEAERSDIVQEEFRKLVESGLHPGYLRE